MEKKYKGQKQFAFDAASGVNDSEHYHIVGKKKYQEGAVQKI